MKLGVRNILLTVGGVLLMLSVLFTLAINIYTFRLVSNLDRFFGLISEEYRAINNDTQDSVITSEGAGTEGPSCVQRELDLDTDPFIGSPDAPVVMIEYSDFECPFCSRYFNESYPEIKERYIDTGLVRLYYKDFPLDNIHPLARSASIAANCLYTYQGNAAFFNMHDQLFALGVQLTSQAIDQLAIENGISDSELAACKQDASYEREIDDDIAEGQSIGISGTPSFVINGELIIGALPLSEFERAIEDALAGNGCQG